MVGLFEKKSQTQNLQKSRPWRWNKKEQYITYIDVRAADVLCLTERDSWYFAMALMSIY